MCRLHRRGQGQTATVKPGGCRQKGRGRQRARAKGRPGNGGKHSKISDSREKIPARRGTGHRAQGKRREGSGSKREERGVHTGRVCVWAATQSLISALMSSMSSMMGLIAMLDRDQTPMSTASFIHAMHDTCSSPHESDFAADAVHTNTKLADPLFASRSLS